MARFLGTLFYRFMQLLGWIVRLTPQFILDFEAKALAFVWFNFIGFRRRTILLNLAAAFPRDPEESSTAFKKRIFALGFRNMENYVQGFFEVMQKTTWSYKKLQERVVLHDVENIRNAIADGKGAFLLAAHMGNWEIKLALAKWVGRPLSCIVRFVRNSFWDEMLKKSREEFEVDLLPENSSGIAAVRAYKRGNIVCFVMDQHTGEPHGILAKFFGLKAWTAKGLAILAPKLGATIIPVYSYREGGKIHVVFEKALDYSDLGECRDEEQMREFVQRCNDRIESWARKFPEQYFWVHRRFKAAIDYRNDKLPFP